MNIDINSDKSNPNIESQKGEGFASSRTGIAVVVYDGECPLCRTLAMFAAKSIGQDAPRFESWLDFRVGEFASQYFSQVELESKKISEPILVRDDGNIVRGSDVWKTMIDKYAELYHLGWLAEKTGFSTPIAKLAQQASYVYRRRCWWCAKG